MTRQFSLGDGAPCDLDSLIDSRLLVQGNSGAGKSWVLRRILEQTHGRVQHLVIDPEGEFSTLRERFDYVYAAPKDGDTVAHPRSAALLAERLLELGASAIIDIYELDLPARRLFVRRFVEALVDAPKALWHPALVVIDEAHDFCPEQGEAESADAVKALTSKGRKRGFCPILATQRLSKLHKDAAAECNNKLIGRTGLDVDVKRAGDELGMTRADAVVALRSLAPEKGEWYAYGPAISPTVRRINVGPVVTKHPKAGARLDKAPPPTDAIRALLPKLSDLPAEAEERARTIEDLKKDNADLRRKLTIAEKAAPAPRVERVEVSVLPPSEREAVVAFTMRLTAVAAALKESLDRAASPGPPRVPSRVPFRVEERHGLAATSPLAERLPRSTRYHETNGHARPPALQRILDALAFLESIGLREADRTQLALLADTTPKSSGYANNLGALRSGGLISPAGSAITLTDAGRAAAHAPDTPPTSEELHAMLRRKLPPARWAILDALIAAYPDAVDRTGLARLCGASPASSGFANSLGALRSLGLIEYPQTGRVVALPALFVEGSR